MSEELNRAIKHAVNYHSLDAKLGMPDWKIADMITREVFKHLCGTTDVQIIERMTPEERAQIGQPAPPQVTLTKRPVAFMRPRMWRPISADGPAAWDHEFVEHGEEPPEGDEWIALYRRKA